MPAIIDTSFWIDFHRGNVPAEEVKRFQELASNGEVLLYQFVWLELQVGFRSEKEQKYIRECRRFAQWVPIASEDVDRAVEIASILRKKGSPIGPPDLLILAAAERLNAILIHHDRHFTGALSHG